jgi:hypothetical protein
MIIGGRGSFRPSLNRFNGDVKQFKAIYLYFIILILSTKQMCSGMGFVSFFTWRRYGKISTLLAPKKVTFTIWTGTAPTYGLSI